MDETWMEELEQGGVVVVPTLRLQRELLRTFDLRQAAKRAAVLAFGRRSDPRSVGAIPLGGRVALTG